MVREVIKKIAAPSTDADLETSDDVCLASELLFWALIWYWDHLKNFIAEIPQGPLGMSIGTIRVTQKRSRGPPARGF